ncbi:hypothetical protein ElyMa_003509900 [Elysia marginata]|uniref:Uncharacterized protein n=1 Tax=Elysia marginata TaxID=1093978 RepID=A0AAV4EFE9_9GAST|nr:hypothetical protein ElyMa_003509900 [Elysia marginata]
MLLTQNASLTARITSTQTPLNMLGTYATDTTCTVSTPVHFWRLFARTLSGSTRQLALSRAPDLLSTVTHTRVVVRPGLRYTTGQLKDKKVSERCKRDTEEREGK